MFFLVKKFGFFSTSFLLALFLKFLFGVYSIKKKNQNFFTRKNIYHYHFFTKSTGQALYYFLFWKSGPGSAFFNSYV